MAQKRMLNKSISVSTQVNKLSLKHQLIFTWAIAHLDDYGLLDCNPEVIKALVVPMNKNISIKDCQEFIKETEKLGLTKLLYDCLEFTGFANHQSITDYKKAKCKFLKVKPPEIPRNPQESPLQLTNKVNKLNELKKELINKKIIH